MAATITAVFFLILTITFSSAISSPEASSPPTPILTCTEELVMFSPCLPYVSAPPNNLSETPNPLCCSVFSSSVHSSAGNCLCYLLREPMILGFPLDRSRVVSLSQICNDQSSDGSFESHCSSSESPVLPPLQNIQFTPPFDSDNSNQAPPSPPSESLAPETVGISPISDYFPTETTSLPQSISNDSPMVRNYMFLLTITTMAASILTQI